VAPGELEGWRRDGVTWLGYVCWSAGVGIRHLSWIDQSRIPMLGRTT
jgi:hypothetical protein